MPFLAVSAQDKLRLSLCTPWSIQACSITAHTFLNLALDEVYSPV